MKIYIGSDHAGQKLKEEIKKYFSKKINIIDLGPERYEKKDDYPDYGKKIAEKISKNPKDKGILICGTGQGMCIVANKFQKVYAALAFDVKSARLSREHDKSNVLCLPGRFLNEKEAIKIINKWLKTKPSKEKRHSRRIKKIKKIEKENFK